MQTVGLRDNPGFLTMDRDDDAVLYAAEAKPDRDRGAVNSVSGNSVNSVSGSHGRIPRLFVIFSSRGVIADMAWHGSIVIVG